MKTIAITSGKGGVGKTVIAANLAIAIAENSRSVVVFDGDFALANLDIVLGIQAQKNLTHMLANHLSMFDILTKGPGNIKFISGGAAVQELIHLSDEKLNHFFEEFAKFDSFTDFFIIDTAGGLSESVMRFTESSDEVLLICSPEPTSVMDSYSMIKTIWMRNSETKIHIIVNLVKNEAEARDIFKKLNQITQQFLSRNLIMAGFLRNDETVRRSVRTQKPCILSAKRSQVSKDIRNICKHLLSLENRSYANSLQSNKSSFLTKLKKTLFIGSHKSNAKDAA